MAHVLLTDAAVFNLLMHKLCHTMLKAIAYDSDNLMAANELEYYLEDTDGVVYVIRSNFRRA